MRPGRSPGADVRVIGDAPLAIEDLVALARGELKPALASRARDRMQRGADIVTALHERGGEI